MGGFGSKNPANCNEEAAARFSSSRDEPSADPSPQAPAQAAFPAAGVLLSGYAGSAHSSSGSLASQAPRPKPAAGGRRVTSDTLSAEWDTELLPDSVLAEEEEMQLAIAMSSSLAEHRSSGSHVCASGGAHGSHAAGGGEFRPPLSLPGTALPEDGGQFLGGKRAADPQGKAPVIAGKAGIPSIGKAPPLGMPGDYAWVDNSDFNRPGASREPGQSSGYSERSAASGAPRSASVGSRPPGSRSSGIVSLPRIGKSVGEDQRAMVRDLHRALPPEPEERAQASATGARSSSSGVRRVMEDLSPISRGPRSATSAEREFNDQFHSCSAAAPASEARAAIPAPPRYESPFRQDQRLRGPSGF